MSLDKTTAVRVTFPMSKTRKSDTRAHGVPDYACVLMREWTSVL